MRLNLSGACGKLERALLHLNELGQVFAASDTKSRGQLTLADEEIHAHPRGSRHLFRVGYLVRPDPIVGLIAGDCIQNIRSALDHLAFELVRRGSDPHPKRPTAVQFPIYSVGRSANKKRPTFERDADTNLPGITKDQRAFVERYQPYHRGKWHLATLAALSNQDKHRVITPTQVFGGRLQPRHLRPTKGSILSVRALYPTGKRVNERTPVMEVIVDVPDAEVEMYATIPTFVAFQERPGHYHRPRVLEEIGETVAEIVGTCARQWGRSADATRCDAWAAEGRKALGLPP